MKRLTASLTVLVGVAFAPSGCVDLLGSGEDDEPLLVEGSWPSPGAAGVSVLAAVTIQFTTGLDPASVAGGVRLETAGRPVIVDLSLSDERTLVVTPSDPLDFGTEYTVVLASALTSRSGIPLTGFTSWTLTTRGLRLPEPNGDLLHQDLEALAHDTMRGRGSGSTDEARAAAWLEERFRAYGLMAPPGGMIRGFEGISRRGDTLLSSRNVIAELPGSGLLADEWIVIGAHYDHIGFRDVWDPAAGPNNGADDNASGTVLVLQLARILRSWIDREGMAGTDRRSVLFAAFGAEEEGLLGSCHYVFEAPTVPLESTRAMLNLDMVGRLRGDVLVVSGQETAAEWPALVENANAPMLTLLAPEQSAPTGSDHACFWQAGVPWLGLFTGYHEEYHTPADDVELIDVPGMERIGALALRLVTRLMVMPRAPAFVGPIPSLAVPSRFATR